MTPLFHLYIFAGLSFAFAIINIIVGLQRGAERAYLYFGIISFCVGMYYLMFPLATSTFEPNAYGMVGLIFFMIAFGLFPWFIMHYGECRRSIVPVILSAGMGLTLVLFLYNNNPVGIRWWNVIAHIVLLGIAVYGIIAVRSLWRDEKTRSAVTLFIALLIFFLLIVDDIIYVHLNKYYLFDLPESILPFDYFFVLFMIIMGARLAREIQLKTYLQDQFILKEQRWQKLLEEVDLIVVEIANSGIINYVNPYYLELTGFDIKDVIGKNWFMGFLPEKEGRKVYNVFQENLNAEYHPNYKNPILTSDGEERMITWSNVVLYYDDGKPSGTVSIGSDVTDRETAFEEIESLKARLELENVLLKAELGQSGTSGEITGKSDAIRYVIHRAGQVAETETTVLLEGETGVGKELVANFIQSHSKRRDKAFVKINCSALPAPLLESEMFGHVKGAFTGADRSKKGLVEMADGGTLFLDEIGEFPLELQPKLLRFLQEGEFMAVGGESQKRVDIRIIAATNRELFKEIENNNFREDLYYRINVYPITIPPLRNRKEDIPEFIDLFVQKFTKEHGKSVAKISKTVMDQMMDYHWPGNIRELENVIERAIIICESDTLKLKDVPLQLKTSKETSSKTGKIMSLENAERDHIIKALKASDWKVHGRGGAAEILGINPNTLRSRMKKLKIIKPS